MDQGRAVKKVFESQLEESRRMGRPRWRWLEGVEKNLREIKDSGSLTRKNGFPLLRRSRLSEPRNM
jgi:hypothetical protein